MKNERSQAEEAERHLLDQEVAALLDEMRFGLGKFGRFASPHEALAVVQEEFDEFKAEIYKDKRAEAVQEALQVAATALRFVHEFAKLGDDLRPRSRYKTSDTRTPLKKLLEER